MLKKMLVVSALLIFCLCTTGQAKITVLPLFNGYLAHGNVFYEEEAGTPSINYDIDFVPALVLSEHTVILPRIGSTYNGTLVAKEIEEEGNIYLQTFDTLFYLKYVHKRDSGWAYRAETGSKIELAREAADEDWATGLYNYNSSHLELSVEKKLSEPVSISGGFRTFTTVFPNYESLAAGTTEIVELQGINVLDTGNLETFVKVEWLLGKWLLKSRISNVASDYPDQKIVSETDGKFLADKRKDTYTNLSVGFSHFLREYSLTEETHGRKFKAFVGVNIKTRTKTSNQNHFDAERIYGIPNYYSYLQTAITPSVTLRFIPSNLQIGLSYDMISKNYTDRLIQDKNGNYSTSGEKLYQNSSVINLRFSCPLMEKLQLYVSGGYRTSQSNMQYEKFYKYNFTAYNFLLGVSYEY